MNERIRELAQQALFESDFDDEQNIHITMAKFAELIIRECVRAASTTPEMRKSGAPERIKEVLGVE